MIACLRPVLACAIIGAPLCAQLPKLEEIGAFETLGGETMHASFSADESRMLTTGVRGDLLLWDFADLRVVKRSPPGSTNRAARLHANGRWAAVTTRVDGRAGLAMLDLETGKRRFVLEGLTLGFGWSRDGARLGALVADGRGWKCVVLEDLRLDTAVPDSWRPRRTEWPVATMHAPSPKLQFGPGGRKVYVGMRGTHTVVDTRSGVVTESQRGQLLGVLDDGRPVLQIGNELRTGTDVMHKFADDEWTVGVSFRGDQIVGYPNTLYGQFRHFTKPDRSGRILSTGWLEGVFVGPRGTLVGLDVHGLLHVQRGQGFEILGGHAGSAPVLTFSRDSRYIAATGCSGAVIRDLSGQRGGTFIRPVIVVPGATGSDFAIADAKGVHTYSPALGRVTQRGQPWQGRRPHARTQLTLRAPNGVALASAAKIAFLSVPTGSKILSAVWDRKTGAFAPLPPADEVHRDAYYGLDPFGLTVGPRNTLVRVLGTPPVMCGTRRRHVKYFGAIEHLRANGERIATRPFRDSLLDAAVDPSGQRVAVAGSYGSRRILRIDTLETLAEDLREDAPTGRIRWLDDKHVVMHCGDALHVLDATTLKELGRIAIPPKPKRDVDEGDMLSLQIGSPGFALSPDRKAVAIGEPDRVRVFRLVR